MKKNPNSKFQIPSLTCHLSLVTCHLSSKKTSGQVMIIALVFLAVVLIIASSLFSRVADFIRFGSNSVMKEQATNLADAGLDYATQRLNDLAGAYPDADGEGTDTQTLPTGQVVIQVVKKSENLKTITATGYIPNSTNPRAKRTVKADVLIDSEQIAFRYAAQVDTDGVDMKNSSRINGTVYTNGNITGSGSSVITGDAWAHGSISSPDPEIQGKREEAVPVVDMPIKNPETWYQEKKQEAEAEEPIDCFITPSECDINGSSKEFYRKKYIGDVTIRNNAIVTVKSGPIYITGNLTVSQGGTQINLDGSFGSNGTVIIADGTISISQGATFNPTSANPKGYILVVTTSTSNTAIQISNQGVNAILYALEGSADLSQTAKVSALAAKGLTMQNSATLDYDTGLAGAQFTKGPGAAWVIKKGTYKFTSSP